MCKDCNSRICNCASASASGSHDLAPIPNSAPVLGRSDDLLAVSRKSEPQSASKSNKRQLDCTDNGSVCNASKSSRIQSESPMPGNAHSESAHTGYKADKRKNSDVPFVECSDVAANSTESFVSKRRRLQAQLCRFAPVGRPPGVPTEQSATAL